MRRLHAGDQLDHYRIESLTARSGMASIFRATDLRTGAPVAIKLLHTDGKSDPLQYDRFHRERDIGEKLDHPGVRKVLSGGDHGQSYMVMEWVEGRLLRDILNERKKLSSEHAVRIASHIAEALAYIHKQGVVHRDLKPENVIVVGEDNIKLIDFGIASNARSRRLTFTKLSQMGTPDYISPEQARGKRGNARSDIYSLGVMLYEMLTGKPPFSGANPLLIMNDRLLNDPVPPREIELSISPQLQEIIYRALERDPHQRYPNADQFIWDLEHQDQVGVVDRSESGKRSGYRQAGIKGFAFYIALALIPVLIFGVLLWVARN